MDVISYALSKKYTDEKIIEQKLKVATVEKELNDYKNTLAQVNVNQEPRQSASGYGIVDLPKNAANGQVSVSVEGETRTNLVRGGNNDLNAWEGTKRATEDGWYKAVSKIESPVHFGQTDIILQPNTTYTFSALLKQVGTATTRLNIRVIDDNDEQYTYHLLGSNTTKREYVTFTTPDTIQTTYIWVYVLEGETLYFKDVLLEEGTEVKSYISGGTKSTISAMRLKSVGKNLFDGKLEDGGISDITGEDMTARLRVRSRFIPVLGGEKYKLTSPVQYYYRAFFYDKNKSFIYVGPNDTATNTTPDDGYMRFTVRNRSNTNIIPSDVESIMLEREVDTEYEPYKESTAYIIAKKDNKIVNLKSVPNGTKDEIRVSGGKAELIKRVGKVTLNGSENWSGLIDSGNSYRIKIDNWPTSNNAIQGVINSKIASNSDGPFENRIDTTTSGVNINSISMPPPTIANHLYMWVLKSKIDAMTGVTTLDKFKAYLNQYPVTLTYQLAEPEIMPVQVSGNIVSNPSGTVYFEKAQPDASVYNNKITIFEQELNIDYIDKLYKIDYQTGVKTEIDASKAVIAEDKKSFTHPDLVNGDMVFFEYFYRNETTEGNATVEFYDSRYTIKDKSTDKYYQWDIEVDNGVPSIKLKEV